ncbi:TIGR02186 family protein [Sphingomonas sp.]|uniref:TIGR02186 family protein n=1 Tax=Sphingomonas sp. TaxID=28214 RepID=UPI003B00CDB3
MKAPLLLACTPLLVGATAPRLVPDVSDGEVRIVYSFTGAELLLFGAILYPEGRAPNRPADVVVVLKGPTEPVLVRAKRRIAGMWVNADSARFRSVPSFYAVASARPLARIVDRRTAAIYELGLDALQLSPTSTAAPRAFEDGLVDIKRRAGLYVEDKSGVSVRDGVLYRARIAVPARVPTGRYVAETFLVQDGKVVAGAVRDVRIAKSGFERFVAIAARRHAILYGIVAVAVSLALGWAAGALFGRRQAPARIKS